MQLFQTSYNNKSVLTIGIPICLKSLHCFTTLFKNQLWLLSLVNLGFLRFCHAFVIINIIFIIIIFLHVNFYVYYVTIFVILNKNKLHHIPSDTSVSNWKL